jgi:hypothetical protein
MYDRGADIPDPSHGMKFLASALPLVADLFMLIQIFSRGDAG